MHDIRDMERMARKPPRKQRGLPMKGTEDDLQLALIALINEGMRRKGMTRKELARQMGITPPAVTQMLRPNGNLCIRTVAKMMDLLGVRLCMYTKTMDRS